MEQPTSLAHRPLAPPTAISIGLLTAPLCLSAVLLILGPPARWVVVLQVLVYAASVVGLLWHLIARRRFFNDLGGVFLIISHAFWFAGPALYQVVHPGLWFGDWIGMNVPDDALVTAGYLIALFLGANGVGYFLLRRRSLDRQKVVAPRAFLVPRERRLALVLLLLAAGLMPYVVFGGGPVDVIKQIAQGRTTKSWSETGLNPAEASPVMTFFWITRAFLVTSGVLSGIYFLLNKKRGRAQLCFAFVLLLVTAIIAFDRGTRSQSAMALIPVLAVFLFNRSVVQERFRVSRLVLPALLMAGLLIAMTQFVRLYRYEPSRETLSTVSMSEMMSPKQDVDFYTETANAVVAQRGLREDINESPLLYFAFNVVPRALWPDKPVSMTQWHYTMYRWGIDIFKRGGNALPSVVGQYYLNFGIPGVLWGGLLFGAIVGAIERRLLQSRLFFEHVALAASAFTFLFVSFRFFAPGFHYSTLLLMLVVLYFGRRAPVGGYKDLAEMAR